MNYDSGDGEEKLLDSIIMAVEMMMKKLDGEGMKQIRVCIYSLFNITWRKGSIHRRTIGSHKTGPRRGGRCAAKAMKLAL